MYNATQLVGLIVFGFAAAAWLYQAALGPAVLRRRALGLAMLMLLLVAEVALGFRHVLHDAAVQVLQVWGWHSDRRVLQLVLLVALMLAFVAFTFLVLRLHSASKVNATQRLAFGSGLGLSTLFAVETLSLHSIDAWLYRPLPDPLAALAWLWLLGGLGQIVAAVRWAVPLRATA